MIFISIFLVSLNCFSQSKSDVGLSINIPIGKLIYASWSNNGSFFILTDKTEGPIQESIIIGSSFVELEDLIIGKNKYLTDIFINFINQQAERELIADRIIINRNVLLILYTDNSSVFWNYYIREEPKVLK